MNLLQSIFGYRCPRCRKGKLFTSPFSFSKPLDMPKHCEVCQQDFEPEPGFYYGAMFVSYGISAFLLLIPGLILVFAFDWSPTQAMLVLILITVLSFFKILRLSRSIWIHINVGYDKTRAKVSAD